ncbi:MAG: large subunit ribosomal protein L13 [Parcubacteria group bacterium Gr01-1014_72]|nr:MAG: large subunit ribosomal protein L13 [Parcubacteria group bacterium Gr01-1014_72]
MFHASRYKFQDANMKTITIDAEGKKLGRVASEAAHVLLGKDTTTVVKNMVALVSVRVVNASKILLDERKLSGKHYTRYTGYPGGLRSMTLREVIAKKGHTGALLRAVKGMLPRNKLRDLRLRRLIMSD